MLQNQLLTVQGFWHQQLDAFKSHPILFLGKLLADFQKRKIGVDQYQGIITNLKSAEQENWFTDRHQRALKDCEEEFNTLNPSKVLSIADSINIKAFTFPSPAVKKEILTGLGIEKFSWEENQLQAPQTQRAIYELKKKNVEFIQVNVNGNDLEMRVEDFEKHWATQRSERIGIYRNVLPHSAAMFYMITDF